MKAGRFVCWSSPDGETEWTPVLPIDTPEWVKNADVIGAMVTHGAMARQADGPWYRVEKLEDTETLIPGAPNLKHTPAALAKVSSGG